MAIWKRTPICISVHMEGENPIFGETSTRVRLDDEAGGYFITLEHCRPGTSDGTVRLDIEELNEIVLAVQDLLLTAPEVK